MEIHILCVTMFICQTSAALRFQITQEDCDRSIDLSKENRVIIDYADSDFRNMAGVCIIDISTSSSSDEMICITSDRPYLIDLMCTWSLSYHIGRYKPHDEKYSCNDFNRKHLCKNTRRVALAYSGNVLLKNVSVSVTLFLKPYIPTTTRRPYRHWSSWSPSSWSSWTSSYNDDDDQKTKEGSGGALIAILFGTIAGVVLLIVYVKCSKKSTPNNQTETYDSIRPAGDNKTHASSSKPEQGPPSYEEYEKNKPVYEPDTNNELPAPPDTENPTIPSAPPPPYPGY